MTDGCLSSDGRHVSLVSKDIEQIENIRKCLQLEAKIGIHTPGNKFTDKQYYRVQWGDITLYKFLLSIGLMSQKSLILGKLHIPDKYFFDFLRGCFDGDGSFYSYVDPRWPSSFMFYLTFASASENHIQWLQATLNDFLHVKGYISKTPRNGVKKNPMFSLRYAKKEGLVVLQKMYGTANEIHLSRKRLKIQEAIGIVDLSLKRETLTK